MGIDLQDRNTRGTIVLIVLAMLVVVAVLVFVSCRPVTPTPRATPTPRTAGNAFYVATNGSASNPGTIGSPWSLAHALSDPSAVNPGDTIYLRGGTYSTSPYMSSLTGTAAAPITVRSYPGEWAKLDGGARTGGGQPILGADGAYTMYRDFEIFCSVNANPSGGIGMRPDGIQANGVGIKIVNMVIHDVGQGISWSEASTNSEVSGNIIYYIGAGQNDHGIYCQNLTGTKQLKDNLFFRNTGWGIHAYATNARLDNFNIEGNISFANDKSNILIGGENFSAQSPKLINNYAYHPPGTGGRAMDVGYHAGTNNATITGNYLASNGTGEDALWLAGATGTITITGNTFYGGLNGLSQSSYPSNVYTTTRPTGAKVFVRANAHEAGRGNVAIYNWDRAANVAVDLSGVLSAGSSYEVRHVGNYFAAPVVTGVYGGGSVSVPMNGLTMAPRVGWAAQATTGPDFGAFVVRTTGTGGPTPPPATATAIPPPTSTAPASATAVPATATAIPPTPASPVVLSQEAEVGTITAPMVLQADAAAQGGGFVTSATSAEGEVLLSFTVPASGTYKLMNRVPCSTPPGSADSTLVSVDGGIEVVNDFCDEPGGGMAIPGPWVWRDVTDRSLGLGQRWTFALTAGSHTVKMRVRDANSAVDAVILTNVLGHVPAVGTPTPVLPTATATPIPPTATRTPTNTRTPTITRTPTKTRTSTRTPTPQTVCYTVTPVP